MKKEVKLFGIFPMYLAVLFSKLIFIPLIGNHIIDAVFTLCITFLLYKRFNWGFFLKSVEFSYAAGLLGVLLAVGIAFLQELIPLFVPYERLTGEQIQFWHFFFILMGFVFGTTLIFCLNFFINYGVMNRIKPWRKVIKLWQRLIISITVTLLNAPYAILLVRNEWLVKQGYDAFYNVF